MKVDEKQVSGDHYKNDYQHWNLLPDLGYGYEYYVGQATKYLTRWRKKNGLPDLLKGQHFIEKQLDLVESRGPRYLPYGHATDEQALQRLIGDTYESHLKGFFAANAVDASTAAVIVSLLFANTAGVLREAIRECELLADESRKANDIAKATANTQLPVSVYFEFIEYRNDGDGIRWRCKACKEVLEMEINRPPILQHNVPCLRGQPNG